ncbi:C39 family peptidase [Streptomyces sp. NA04227]|uniref:papain-like cysteine protease family protein n=1 Tax=Streptomyces sp. NA04227 TaxID=2742136 RepID=UPI001591752D|nr:papain-like cysteine protease family protein [Streptomyces sp. NA04227]QKW05856.1 C39 family peptidase [Streptomyces sp. NA04227]
MRLTLRTPHRRRRLSALVLATAALVAVPATTASAATAPEDPGSAPAASLRAANRLGITMQAQEKDNWCWAASGNTIADFYGHDYSQNTFCNAAFGRSTGTECPNNQATLGDVQNAFDWAGIGSGSYVGYPLNYSTVQSEINAGRPVETRIGWTSGGGHMHVVYGFDTANNWVYWGDPWPSSDRYNWASHSWYVDNNTFDWTHSLYRIGA